MYVYCSKFLISNNNLTDITVTRLIFPNMHLFKKNMTTQLLRRTYIIRTRGTSPNIYLCIAADMLCYRRMLRISWTEKRTNKSILDELQSRRELLAQIIKNNLLSLDKHAETIIVIL